MRFWFISVFLLLLKSSGLAQQISVPCINSLDAMPKAWLPTTAQRRILRDAPWQGDESRLAKQATKAGIDEIIMYFARNPSVALELWDDSIESLMQAAHASKNDTNLDLAIKNAARKNLNTLLDSYESFQTQFITCEEFEKLLPLSLLAHRLYPANDHRVLSVTSLTNAAYQECYSLKDATGLDFQDFSANDTHLTPDDLEIFFDASLWILWLLEAEVIPQLEISDRVPAYVNALWQRIKAVPLSAPKPTRQGTQLELFLTRADLATHIAHVPTAVHRFPLYQEDHPELYRFHRSHFYKVMTEGDLDLFASFVDTLRQYGCTPANDRQVRDGTRHLINEFINNNHRWILGKNNSQSNQTTKDHYDRIHRPWTAVLGLRDRKLNPPDVGSLGGHIRKRLNLSRPNAE